MKIRAIRIEEHGKPNVMALRTIAQPEPGPGQIRIRHSAIGVNFIDTYHRSGLYSVALPSGIGVEAAGHVDAVGEGVKNWHVGERAAYASGPIGAYADANVVQAERAVRLPDGISDEIAAAALLKGMTAQYLLKQTYKVKKDDTILFHAAAGGVGLVACQWAKALGAMVTGTAGSESKAKLALAHGCDNVILYRTDDVAKKVRTLTDGEGVRVVYDGVGKVTFMSSLDCLRPRGLLVSFGNASGPVTGVDLGILAAKGSLYVTRPSLFHYTATPQTLQACADDVFGAITSGIIKVEIHQRYPLENAVEAHRDLEARRTTGATLLVP